MQPNCHVSFAYKFYSVPFEYLGEEMEIRATGLTVEVFYHHQRVASHKRLWGKDDYATIPEHMPPEKLFFTDWNRDRFLSWARTIGFSTTAVIQAILDRAVIEQQAYRSCFGLLGLKEKFDAVRLERACGLLLLRTQSPTYQQVKNLLAKDADLPTPQKKKENRPREEKRGFQRGAASFGGDPYAPK